MTASRRLPPHLEKNSASNVIRTVKIFVAVVTLVLGAGYAAKLSQQIWESGQKGVENARVLSEGQQIQAAARLFRTDHPNRPITLKLLREEGYLETLPQGWTDSVSHTHVRYFGVSHEMCARLNENCGVCKDAKSQDAHPDTVQASFGCLPSLHMAFFKYE